MHDKNTPRKLNDCAGGSRFQTIICLLCTCCRIPPVGRFTVGKEYAFTYMIDGEKVVDDEEESVTLCEATFCSCFKDITEAITSYCPMAADKTTYSIYLLLGGEGGNKEEIRACAKVLNLNYLQAKKRLDQKRCLLLQGSAWRVQEVVEKLEAFEVRYEIEPPFPYGETEG